MNRRLSLDRDGIKGLISEHVRKLIRIYNVCGVKDERAWDIFYDIIFLDAVTTRHISQFQLMWPHCGSRSSPFREWCPTFCSYMGQMFHKRATKWTIRGGTTPMPSGIKSITQIHWQPARGELNPPASISLCIVAMIPGQRLSLQAASCTSQATSWPFDHRIEMSKSMMRMMMKSGQIPECRAVYRAVLAMAMTMTMARVKRTRRAVRNGPGKGMEQRMGTGKGRWLRTERGIGRDTVKGKVLLNKLRGEMISLVPLLCSCRRKCMRQTGTRRANQSGYN